MAGLAKLKLEMEIDGDKIVVKGLDNVDSALDRTARATKSASDHMSGGMRNVSLSIGDITVASGKMASQSSGHMRSMSNGMTEFETSIQNVTQRVWNLTTAAGMIATPFLLAGVAIKKGVDTVDEFQMSVTGIAAQLTQLQGPENIAQHYKESVVYAGSLARKLEEVDANSQANDKGLQAMLSTMTTQGVVLDVNNKKQVDSFTSLSNAIAMFTGGQDQQLQMYQEMRSLTSGQVDAHSQVSRMIDTQIKQQGIYKGGLKDVVELGKQHGDLLERLQPYLVGINAATGDISQSWSAAKSSLETATNLVIRAGFTETAKDMSEWLRQGNVYLKEHSTEIGGTIQQGWRVTKGLIEGSFTALEVGGVVLQSTILPLMNDTFLLVKGTVQTIETAGSIIASSTETILLFGAAAYNAVGGIAAITAGYALLTTTITASMAANPIGWVAAGIVAMYVAAKPAISYLDELIYKTTQLNLTGQAYYNAEKQRAAEADARWQQEKQRQKWLYEEGGKTLSAGMMKELYPSSVPKITVTPATTDNSKEETKAAKKAQAEALRGEKDMLAAMESARKDYNSDITKDAENTEKEMLAAMKDAQQDYYDYVSQVNQLVLQDQKKAAAAALAAIEQEKKARADLAAMTYDNDMTEAGQLSDPYAAEAAMMEVAYQKKFDLIAEERRLLEESLYAKETNAQTQEAISREIAELDRKTYLTEAEQITAGKKLAEDAFKSKLALASNYAGIAAGLFESLANTQDVTSRSGFESAKAMQLGAAVINTAGAIMNALATVQPYPLALAAAAAAAATGAMQISTIQSTSFGGGGSVSAPAGSMASGGGSGSSDSGLGNLTLPSMSIADSQVQDSSRLLAESLDANSIAIGRMSKSIDELTSLFQEGGAGMGLATNAPGMGVNTSELSNYYLDAVKSSLTAGWKSVEALFTGVNGLEDIGAAMADWNKAMQGIAFGGEWVTTAAGISVGITDGVIAIQDYLKSEKDGGIFGSDKKKTNYTDNVVATEYFSNLLQPFINDLSTMADTLNLSFNPAEYQAAATKIKTSGRTAEEIGEDLSALMLATLQGMALTIDGLGVVIGSYDDAYARLKAINDAWVTANEQLQLVGDNALEQSITVGAAMEASINSIWGGLEGFTESMEAYREVMYTDAEIAAQDAIAAAREINTAWMGTLQDTYGDMPATVEAFNDLRDSIDPTSPLYQAVTAIGVTFGTAAAAAKELADANSSLIVELLDLIGQSAASLALSRSLETDGMDPSTLAIKQQIYAAEDANSALDALSSSLDAAKQLAQDEYNATIEAIDAQEQLAQAAAEATKTYINEQISLQEALYAEQTSALETAYNAQKEVYAAQAEAAQDYVSQMSAVASTLQSAYDSLVDPMADTLISRQAAQAQISSYVKSGSLPMNGELDAALGVVTQSAARLFTNSFDYKRDAAATARDVQTLNNRAQGQLSDAERQLQAIQDSSAAAQVAYDAQLALLESTNEATLASLQEQLSAAAWSSAVYNAQREEAQAVYDAEVSRLDGILSAAQEQVNAAYGTTTAVLSVADSVNNLAAALSAYTAYAGAGAVAGSLPSYAVGTSAVPYDMVAQIHQNEIVMDAQSAAVLRKYGIPTSGGNNEEVVAELRALRSETKVFSIALARNTQETSKMLKRWENGGMPIVRTAA